MAVIAYAPANSVLPGTNAAVTLRISGKFSLVRPAYLSYPTAIASIVERLSL